MNLIQQDSKDFFLDYTCLISITDKFGKIIHANQKFCDTSGYTLDELLGQDHKVVNSGVHSPQFWRGMYHTVINKREVWESIVTNRNKNGQLYYVKSWIKAEFDENNKLSGFVSVRQDFTDLIKQQEELSKKNTYLEHATKILRHDMHSGINTYIPRGISSLQRRLTPDLVEQYKLDAPLKLLSEGLKHTQKVYKGVYEFTNLVKYNAQLHKETYNLSTILKDFVNSTSYSDQVIIKDLPDANVNEALFCTAIDNLIRNGLKYNDSPTKQVIVYFDYETNELIVEDNGRGLSLTEFKELSKPYTRKQNQKESGTGLGLNISCAILKEHGFDVTCYKLKQGTRFKITITL